MCQSSKWGGPVCLDINKAYFSVEQCRTKEMKGKILYCVNLPNGEDLSALIFTKLRTEQGQIGGNGGG